MAAKRSIVIAGRKTSITLEDPFWAALREIAVERKTSLATIVNDVNRQRSEKNLSSTLRIFILDHYRRKCGSIV